LSPAGISFDVIARGFADSVVAKRRLLDLALTPAQRSAVLASVSEDIRKLCDVGMPTLIVPLVSAAARVRADTIGVDLCRQSWHAQPRFDRGRSVFHAEHITPVRALREMCLSAPSAEALTRSLSQAIRIAWILKEEDRRLTELGYRATRPDPDAAYRDAGIELVECHPRLPEQRVRARNGMYLGVAGGRT
jgi:hypothetical protein